MLNQVAAGPGLHFVTPNGQEVSYHTGESGVLPVSTIPFYPSTTHVQRNVEQRQNDKVIYYVPCHRETDEVRARLIRANLFRLRIFLRFFDNDNEIE